ncbi:uncharacterized protein MONBRDRAFT_31492 [Monosiga brevicollis MX1]|uniref:Uncharacterized protein n=1 Tax=Monosiga brevicollis TaxID=81824 RepID=A9UTJ1_MONBE|nr:uncharacterized protein MONBRDRAFT_31492 [Monosiga brevicollis MX1]EDQ91256.1 predicted protein [Monosiga brevicollis MX1]|eukprot:XP_001743678.1 hypothetical protein [Monosiga brevicollis MX1]
MAESSSSTGSASATSLVASARQTFEELPQWAKYAVGAAAATAVAGGVYYAVTRTATHDGSQVAAAVPHDSMQRLDSPQCNVAEHRQTSEPAPAVKPEEVARQSPEDKAAEARQAALAAKKEGNAAYKNKKWSDAVSAYSKGLKLIASDDKEAAALYCNRAAAYLNLKQYERVEADCTRALKIDPRYAKALNRRAQAYEYMGKPREAMFDFSALLWIERFSNEATQQAMERVLNTLCMMELPKIMKNRPKRLPARTSIETHFDSFGRPPRESATVEELEKLLQEQDKPDAKISTRMRLAHRLVKDKKYEEAMRAYQQVVDTLRDAEQTDITRLMYTLALTYLSSFKMLSNCNDEALELLNTAHEITSNNVFVLIRRATVLLEKGRAPEAIADAEKAVATGNPFAFICRGQVHAQTGRQAEAFADFEKAIAMEKNTSYIPYIHVVLKALQTDPAAAGQLLDSALEKFSDVAIMHQFKGEVLMNLGQLAAAEQAFDQALTVDPDSPNAIVNKGMVLIQQGKLREGQELIEQALKIDPLCEAAYARLAELEMQKQNGKKAVEYYQKAIDCASVPGEIQQLLQHREAAYAQDYVVTTYPELMMNMSDEALRSGL